MGKDCQCTTEADKLINKSSYDFAAIIRVGLFTITLLAFFNVIAYYFFPQHYIAQNIVTLTNIFIFIAVITTCRTLFVGTCCLPDLQLSPSQVQAIVQTRDVIAQQRIIANRMKYAKTLSQGLQIQTITYDVHTSDQTIDYGEFKKIISHIESSFPLVHKHLERHIINEHSLIYCWKSTNPNPTQKPYCLTAHLDVVPCPEPEKWVHPPFSGVIDDKYIHGRGAIDDKQNVYAILEAVEDILAHSPQFSPSRDIYLAFGQDEEIGGENGAKKCAEWFFNNLGPNCFDFLCDEGLFIVDGIVGGHKKPIAFVCVAEKGCVNVELSIEVEPGHASAPDVSKSAIGILSRAVAKIEANPMPTHFKGMAENMFDNLKGGFSGHLKFIMMNLWLFTPIVKKILSAGPQTATTVKTTAAVTVFKSGSKLNILPSSATACINHRIHPSDSVQDVLEWNKKVINDPRVKISVINSLEPSPVSDHTTTAFKNITSAIYQTFDDICSVVPGMFVANSDSRWYWNLAPDIYRFNPILLNKEEVQMFHGFNEKISIDAYSELIFFWRNFVVLSNEIGPNTQKPLEKKHD